MTGKLVKNIFEQSIEGGTMYNAGFKPDAIVSGMYFSIPLKTFPVNIITVHEVDKVWFHLFNAFYYF